MIQTSHLLKSLLLCCSLILVNGVMGQKVEFETVEINYGDIAPGSNGVRVFKGKLQVTETSTLGVGFTIKGGNSEIVLNVTLNGTDAKGRKYKGSFDAAFVAGETNYKGKIEVKVEKGNPISMEEVTVTATDKKTGKSKSATESFQISKTKPAFALILNGLNKPPANGQCQSGRCFCIEDRGGSDCEGRLLDLGNILVNQQLAYNKEKSLSTLDFTISLKNYDADEINLIKRLMIWGILNFEADVTDDFKNTVSVKPITPAYKEGATEVELFKGSFSNQKNEKNRITGISLMEINPENNDKTTLKTQYHSGYTGPTSNFHVWNEIWLIDQGVDYCKRIRMNEAFMTQTTTEKAVAVVLALNNTKQKDPNDVEALLTSRRVWAYSVITWQAGKNKPYETTAQAVETNTGRWLFNDTVDVKDGVPAIQSIRIYFVNTCKDTWLFEATHTVDLKSGSLFDRKLGGIMGKIGGKVSGSRVNAFLITPGSGISVTGGSIVISNNSEFTVEGTLINVIDGNFKKQKVTTSAVLRGRWDDNYSDGKSPGTWSSSRQMFVYTFSFNASKEKPVTLTGYTLYLVTEKKDTIVYESTGEIGSSLDGKHIMVLLDKGEKIRYFNPCKIKYKLKEITYAETSASGMYGLKVSFQFENTADVPDSVAMIVEVKDCNGTSSFIQITLKYDAKTQTYSGAETLTEAKGCRYELVYGEIAAYNSCGDKTVWSFDTTKSKSNGSGTRNVSTANTGKPGLL